MDDDPSDTERLKAVQLRRSAEEASRAKEESDPEEARTHARRGDKAAYLADKLAEQEESQDDG